MRESAKHTLGVKRAQRYITERNEEEENHDEDEKKNNCAFSSSFLSHLNLP